MRTLIRSASMLIFVALMVALTAPACSGRMDTDATTDTAGPETVTVNVLGNRFDPQELTVPAGSTVVWHNTTSVDHNVQCEGEFDAALRPGQDFQHTFDNPGSYRALSTTFSSGIELYVDITVE